MKKTNQVLSLACALALSLSCVGTGAFAADTTADVSTNTNGIIMTATTPDGEVSNFTFDGKSMTWTVCDEAGNIVPTPYINYNSSVTLKSGYTTKFHNADDDDFYLDKGTVLTFKATFSSNTLFSLGYTKWPSKNATTGGTTTTSYYGTAATTSNSVSIVIPSSGYYHFWVTNLGVDTKVLNSASISNV